MLKTQILSQGCLEPLCVWKTEDDRRILLDGHNRYTICTEDDRRYIEHVSWHNEGISYSRVKMIIKVAGATR